MIVKLKINNIVISKPLKSMSKYHIMVSTDGVNYRRVCNTTIYDSIGEVVKYIDPENLCKSCHYKIDNADGYDLVNVKVKDIE